MAGMCCDRCRGNTIGRIEPKLAQRLSELMTGGNRYAAPWPDKWTPLRVLIARSTRPQPARPGIVPRQAWREALRGGYFASARYDEYGEI